MTYDNKNDGDADGVHYTDPMLSKINPSILSHYMDSVMSHEVDGMDQEYAACGHDTGVRAAFIGFDKEQGEIYHFMFDYPSSVAISSLLKAGVDRRLAAALTHRGLVRAERCVPGEDVIVPPGWHVHDVVQLPCDGVWCIAYDPEAFGSNLSLSYVGDYGVVGRRNGQAISLDDKATVRDFLKDLRSIDPATLVARP